MTNSISSNTSILPCPLCGGVASETFSGMVGYVEGSHYDVYECSRCRSSFVDQRSDLEGEYNIIYGTDPTKDPGYAYYLYLAQAAKQLKDPLTDFGNFSAIFWGVVRALRDAAVPKGARILELGSGLGYFTHALNVAGYACEGLEYSPTAVAFAQAFFKEPHTQGSIEEFSGTHVGLYDVVIATEVIEHVQDPNAFIAHILAVLKPGGRCILTTPIKDIHPTGTIWATEPAPVHLWWFTEQGIADIAQSHGASVSFVDFTPYTARKVWHVVLGTPHVSPTAGPLVSRLGEPLRSRRKGYRERLMGVLPAWMYIKLVSLYHDLRFLQRDKTPSRRLYGMCAVLEKPVDRVRA